MALVADFVRRPPDGRGAGRVHGLVSDTGRRAPGAPGRQFGRTRREETAALPARAHTGSAGNAGRRAAAPGPAERLPGDR
ncbi:hypothetical protein ACF061_33415 [Streptomyces sp. NPDC015220]|uniref:hypothetical protein n=1 Tax=Streptomyces sp. NPDC015220 TaxID=3364947 RepID=UPI0036FAC28F